MYDLKGMYMYHSKLGSNWRAVAAFFIGCIPPLPGFVNSIVVAGGSTTSVSLGGQRLFGLGYMYSFFAAGVFYYGFMKFFPHTESMLDHPETGEDIIAQNDAKNMEKRAAEGRRGIMAKIFKA
jgi:NCS1 family nucleobase:cation symporter-1